MYDLMTPTMRRNQYQTSKDTYTEFGHSAPLFKPLENPPNTKIQSLWADLLVIEQSPQPEILINAWQSTPSSKYDFSLGRDKIVVKCTPTEDRIHGFSLDQLRPSVKSNILVASTVIRESDPCTGGLSLKDLYARIRSHVSAADSMLRLYQIISQVVGTDVAHYEGLFFDYPSAVDYLEFYDGDDVPAIDRNCIPAQISDLSFSCNLSGLIDVRKGDASRNLKASSLFRCLV